MACGCRGTAGSRFRPKLTAQLLPVAETEPQSVRLQFRPAGVEAWREAPPAPLERGFGRYRPENFYFPHRELVRHVGRHNPDLLVFAGDQLYENNPTRRPPGPDPALDYLYKWALWMWAFRDLTRDTPAVVLVDRRAREYVLECWPWDVDPAAPGARQFEGWPYRLSFDECDGRFSGPTRQAGMIG